MKKRPNFNVLLDPKCDWALQHLEQFPVEINKADYHTLLRVPGLGVNSARRIVAARKYGNLTYVKENLPFSVDGITYKQMSLFEEGGILDGEHRLIV